MIWRRSGHRESAERGISGKWRHRWLPGGGKNTNITVDVTYHAPCSDVTVGTLITTVTEGELTFRNIQKNVGNIWVIPGYQIIETYLLSIQGPFIA